MQRFAGMVMVIGATMFASGVFTPVMLDVFGTSNSAMKLQYIENSHLSWDISNALNGTGALISAIGFILFAWYGSSVSENIIIRIIAYAGGGLTLLGSIYWGIISIQRIVQSPQKVIYGSDPNSWTYFSVYTYSTLIGMILTGFAIARIGNPKWSGWLMLVISVLMLLAFIDWGDLPPIAYYPVMLITGCALTIKGGRSASEEDVISSNE